MIDPPLVNDQRGILQLATSSGFGKLTGQGLERRPVSPQIGSVLDYLTCRSLDALLKLFNLVDSSDATRLSFPRNGLLGIKPLPVELGQARIFRFVDLHLY